MWWMCLSPTLDTEAPRLCADGLDAADVFEDAPAPADTPPALMCDGAMPPPEPGDAPVAEFVIDGLRSHSWIWGSCADVL